MLKPMLAATAPSDLEALRYPLYISEKLDGVRCLISNGIAYSRSLKPLPNRHLQSLLSDPVLQGLDGEIVVGPPNASDCLRKTMSAVMSVNGEPDFRFYAFDIWSRGKASFEQAIPVINAHRSELVIPLEQRFVTEPRHLEELEAEFLSLKYEGAIAREPLAPYKNNRSTLREQYLLKIKRFQTAEATVVGTTELMHNLNEPQLDFLGHTKRSSHQENKVPGGMLGTLVCRAEPWGQFEVGTGFTQQERQTLWSMRNSLPGKQVTFKYFPVGIKDRPRHPVFLSFRDSRDIS